jgi:hypothetical protein
MRAGNGNLAEMEPFIIDSILQMRKLVWHLERLSLLHRLTSLLTSTRLGFHPCWPSRRLNKASSRPNTTVTVSAPFSPWTFSMPRDSGISWGHRLESAVLYVFPGGCLKAALFLALPWKKSHGHQKDLYVPLLGSWFCCLCSLRHAISINQCV